MDRLRERTESCGVALDVRATPSIRAAIDETVSLLGSVDVAVCNAGLNVGKSALDVTDEDRDAVVNVNLRGVFFSAQAAAAQMVRQGRGGKVVSIASIMGLVGSPFGSGVAYCASKAGVVNLTRALSIERAELGINVNTVAPTFVPTPLTEQLLANPTRLQAVLERTPMKQVASPESIADAVVFLSSPRRT